MEKPEFKKGEDVCLRNNKKKIYTFIEYKGEDKAKCVNANGKEETLYLLAIEKLLQPPLFPGIMG